MPRKKKELKTATGMQIEKEQRQDVCSWCTATIIGILIFIVVAVIIFLFGKYLPKAQATPQDPCEMYCADWSRGSCQDWDYRLCHHNPSQTLTLNFNNYNACQNHTGTPHSNGTYDTRGACPAITPTATPTSTPTPTNTPTPTPTEIPQRCEQEAWTCGECQELQDNICYENQQKYCSGEYGCGWSEECEVGGDFKVLQECRKVWKCETTCEVEPTPTPTPEPKREESKPSGCTGDCSAPAPTCGSANTTKQPANFHVYRNGGTALLKWWATEGNKVHAYWKLNGSGDWQHSLTADNTGYLEIGSLGNLDWTFGLQQVNDCGGGLITAGEILSVIDGNTHNWILFR